MAKIDIKRTHTLSHDEITQKINNLAKEMEGKSPSITSKWESDTVLSVSGTGIKKGNISFTTSELRVQIDLSFAASMMKGKIETKINSILDKELG